MTSLRRRPRYDAAVGEEFLATSRFFDHQFKRDIIKIMPGQFFVASGEVIIATVLGSCVSAVIWDPVTRIGGMNHFMLAASSDENGEEVDCMRYGQFAMDTLIERVLAQGAMKQSLEAKVFGGGRVLRGFNASDIGDDNAAFVLQYLEERGIPISACNLGDVYPRKLYFFPDSGRVMMRKMKTDYNPKVARIEQAYRANLRH